MISGNKGEWSEIYVLFKLLGDNTLQLGDQDLGRLQGFVYPILKVIRYESSQEVQYSLRDDIIIISGGEKVLTVPISLFKEKSELLLQRIRDSKNGTFDIPEIESFMESINCLNLKAGSGTKTDITVVIHDVRTSQQPTLGFSIKSQLGNPSTLLNAGRTTNFVYKLVNFTISSEGVQKINEIDSRRKIMDRIEAIRHAGGELEFSSTANSIFSNNLTLIDSRLPELLAQLILSFYTSKSSKTVELVQNIAASNPLDFDESNSHKYYEYKLKRFLTDVALGMMPSKVWSGEYDATGGYIVIRDDGDLLCYHIYNMNEFENYLFANTKFETASSKRHNFGQIYEYQGDRFFNLNLQIRFIK